MSWFGDIGDAVSSAGDWAGNQLSGLFSGGGGSLPSANTNVDIGNLGGVGGAMGGFFDANTASSSALPATNVGVPSIDLASMNSFSNPTSAVSATGGANNIAGVGTGAPSVPSADAAKKPSSTDSILASLGLKGTSPIGALVSGGGLAYDLLSGSPSASAEKQLKSIAGSQNQQGQQLESYIANGTLPPGAQQWVDNQSASQKASIRSKYAQMGMSGSTAEVQELNNVDAQATAQMFQIASSLLNTGVQETGASGQLYKYLMDAQNADQNEVSQAIQNFVSQLGGAGSQGGAGKTISLKI